MSKWYDVVITTVKTVAVEVDDDLSKDDAVEFACGEVGDFTEAECKGVVTDPVEIDRLKRHADLVLAL